MDIDEANAFVWTQLNASCTHFPKAQQLLMLAGDVLDGHSCWCSLVRKFEVLGAALAITKQTEFDAFRPQHDDSPIDTMDRIQFLLHELRDLPTAIIPSESLLICKLLSVLSF